MVPELSLEIIYYKQKTDFKLEFLLCSACSVRFLSTLTTEPKALTRALKRALSRSRAVVLVGSFCFENAEYLPKLISSAVGIPLAAVDQAHYDILSETQILLPAGAIPLVSISGNCGGCVLERADQSLILLTDDFALRHEISGDLVCPYLAHFAGKKKPAASETTATATAAAEKPAASLDRVEANAVQQAKAPNLNQPETHEKPKETAGPEADSHPITPLNSETKPLTGLAKAEQIIRSALQTADDIVAAMGQEGDSAVSALKSPENPLYQKPDKLPLGNQAAVSAETGALSQTPHAAPEPEREKYQNPSLTIQPLPPEPEQPTADAVLPLLEEPLQKLVSGPGYSVLEQPDRMGHNVYQNMVMAEPPKRQKRKLVRAIISVILVICVILGAYFGYEYVYQPVHCSAVYSGIQEMYGQSWDSLPENMLMKFGRLYSTNRDISGWLSLPVCEINYPVVTTVRKSEAYYSTHLFEGSVSEYGTPYMNEQPDNNNFYRNLIIYGKSFADGQMFSKLKQYLSLENYRQAPVFTFDTVFVENKWKIFAVFEVPDERLSEYCQSTFFDDSAFHAYLEKLRAASMIETGIELTEQDELITLVSKGDSKNVVVVARKVREGESPLVDVTESRVRDYKEIASHAVPAIAPGALQEVTPSKPADSSVDPAMADNASSRYEQQGPVSSQVAVKPNQSISSKPASRPSSTVNTSGVASNQSSSSAASNSSAIAVGPGVQLPTITVTNQSTGIRFTGNAADILAQVIEAEMGSGYHLEALKAQTVAAYSWLICNGALNGKAPTVPMKPAGARAKQAVQEVAGVVAVSGGNIAQTFYYAISAGKTANCQDIWVASLPYLVSVDSSVDKNVSGFQTIRSYRAVDVAAWVKASLGVDLTRIHDKNQWFKCTYDQNGLYVKTVNIGGSVQKGTYLREKIFTSARVGGANVLRSSAYTILYNQNEDKFTFTVKGYGHGVGMSQVGANAYAKSGWNYEQILKHYYKGISLGMYIG